MKYNISFDPPCAGTHIFFISNYKSKSQATSGGIKMKVFKLK